MGRSQERESRRAQWAFVAGGVWVQMASMLVLLEGILSGWRGLAIKSVLALFRTQPQFQHPCLTAHSTSNSTGRGSALFCTHKWVFAYIHAQF